MIALQKIINYEWNLPLSPVIHVKDYSYLEYPRRGHKLRIPEGLGLGVKIAIDV